MKNICFQVSRKTFLAIAMVLCLALPALAQKISVTGTVYEPSGEPAIGASVFVQGTTIGVSTDIDGNFKIEAPADGVITVSYVGCESQNVAIEGRTNIQVYLKESGVNLDELVVVGYGAVKKSDATGSVAVIKPDDIEAGMATSVQDMLVGQTPGVVVTTTGGPEGAANIRIRGGSSLNASNDPLIVVDGVPLDNGGIQGMGNSLAMISPDNIESMTILKDASATAIYGSRASNGVIIITTKRGQSGRPQVSFSANMYVNTAQKTWDVFGASEYRDLIAQYYGEDSSAYRTLGNANTNWQDEVLRTTVSSDFNLSVGGSIKWLPYRVSVSYTNSNGILKTTKMDRVTAGISLNPKFFEDHLSVNANVKGYYLRNKFGNTGAVNAALAYDPTQPVYADAYPIAGGTAASQFGQLYNGFHTWADLGNDGNLAINKNASQNPVSMLADVNNYADVYRSNGNLQLDYSFHFLPELHANLNLGYDVSKTDEYYKVAQNSPTAWRNHRNDGAGYENYIYQQKTNTLLDFYLNYKKDVESIYSSFDVTAGYSWQRFAGQGWNYGSDSEAGIATTTGFSSPYQTTGGFVLNYDQATEASIGKPFAPDPVNAEGNFHWKNRLQLLSFFGRINYIFMERYLLTFTLRGDATSRFSKDNRWGVFPSVALGWKINDEAFMASTRSWLNDLKLRLGWGVTGQQDVGSTCNYLPQYRIAGAGSYYPVQNANGNISYISPIFLEGYNPDLKWESTTTWNAGLDFSVLNNRITGAIDYYYRDTKDLLSFVTVPAGSSTTNMLNRNIGSMKNYGIEFNITARPVVTRDFTWTVSYNVAWNHNEITELNDNAAMINVGGISGGTGNTVQAHAVGHPAFSYLLLQQVYDAQGNPIEGCYVDQNGDGKIDVNDRVLNHSKDPKVTMTFGSQFRYKNWDFGFNLRASIGNYVYNNVLSTHNATNDLFGYGLTNLVKNGGNYMDAPQYMSDYYLRNGSFLRCDNITLGYTFENLLKDRLRLRVFGAVQNPFIITKYKGLDPEVFDGIDNNVYPKATTYSLGLVATF